MKIFRGFNGQADRYEFDTGECSYANGFAQVDTRQDAPYFGTWCNPSKRAIVSFCEGDITIQFADDDAEFAQALRELIAWNNEAGYGPAKIDACASPDLKAKFEALGLADAIH